MCVPLSDETWGQVPLLYYISEDNIDIASLDRFLRVQLAAYKVPKNMLPFKHYLIHLLGNCNVINLSLKDEYE